MTRNTPIVRAAILPLLLTILPACVETRGVEPSELQSTQQRIAAAPFSMIVASDTQVCRVSWGDAGSNCRGSSGDTAIDKIHHYADSMNNLTLYNKYWPKDGTMVTKPQGLIVNGDLTEYWHAEEYYVMNKDFNLRLTPTLQANYYPGLGNHDYSNNVNDSSSFALLDPTLLLYGANANAIAAVRWMDNRLGGNWSAFPYGNYKIPNLVTSDAVSRSYVFDIGNYRFIQMHYHPSYDRPSIGVGNSINWLWWQVEYGRQAGKKIILNFHDGDDNNDIANHMAMMTTYMPIVAINIGHYHDSVDYDRDVIHLGYKTGVPIYYGGSSMTQRFVLAEYSDTQIRTATVDASGANLISDRTIQVYNKGDLVQIHMETNAATGLPYISSSKSVGSAWNEFTQLTGGKDGKIYAVNSAGGLQWYKHNSQSAVDGSNWKYTSAWIGEGWNQFTKVIGGIDGTLFAMQPNGDLYHYQDRAQDGTRDWYPSGAPIGSGWNIYAHIFSAPGGVIYAVNSTGQLFCYKYQTDTGTWQNNGNPVLVGTSGWEFGDDWGKWNRLFAGADGAIYGVKNYGLYYIKHTSQATCGTSFSHIGMQPIHHGSWLKLAKPFMGNEKDMYFVATEAGNVPDSRGAL